MYKKNPQTNHNVSNVFKMYKKKIDKILHGLVNIDITDYISVVINGVIILLKN